MTTLQRLLQYPHAAVFDKDPAGELAFRLRHPDVASWRVSDRVLTAQAGVVERVYDLSSMTVGGLAAALQADGFEVLSINPSLAHLSALVLVESEGSESSSNGDRLIAFTSLLWVLLSAYSGELSEAGRQVREALRQMIITQAEGEWLDVWGGLYGVGRKGGESDAGYAPRIPREAFRIRCNARAIELAIRDETGSDVRIEEPWMQIFRLDSSLLSGPDKFYDGEFVGYHLIQPTARTNVDWQAVRAIIDRNRAAGVMVLGPRLYFGSWVDSQLDGQVHLGVLHRYTDQAVYEDRFLLDHSLLGTAPIPNHAALHRKEILRSSQVLVPQEYEVGSVAFRDYRVFYIDLVYASQYWEQVGAWTWENSSPATWEIGPIIGSGHTRSS